MSNVVDNTKIENIMSGQLVSMPVASSASDIAKKMTGQKVGSILVADHENKPVGIVTEWYIVRQVRQPCSQDLPLDSIPAALLMSARLVVVEASNTLRTTVELMVRLRLKLLTVKNKMTDEQVIGIQSVVDIMRYIETQLIFADGQSSIFSLLSSVHVE